MFAANETTTMAALRLSETYTRLHVRFQESILVKPVLIELALSMIPHTA